MTANHFEEHTGQQTNVLETLENYWKALEASKRLPTRTQIDPRAIDRALPYSMILEEVYPGVVRIRVAGQRVAERFEFDLRGMTLASLFDPTAAAELKKLARDAFERPSLVSAPLVGGGMLLLLPLNDQFGAPARALCGLSFGSANGLLRFDQTRVSRTEPICEAIQNKRPTHGPALRLVVNNS